MEFSNSLSACLTGRLFGGNKHSHTSVLSVGVPDEMWLCVAVRHSAVCPNADAGTRRAAKDFDAISQQAVKQKTFVALR